MKHSQLQWYIQWNKDASSLLEFSKYFSIENSENFKIYTNVK